MPSVRLGSPWMLDRSDGSRTSSGPIVSAGSRPRWRASAVDVITQSRSAVGPSDPNVTALSERTLIGKCNHCKALLRLAEDYSVLHLLADEWAP